MTIPLPRRPGISCHAIAPIVGAVLMIASPMVSPLAYANERAVPVPPPRPFDLPATPVSIVLPAPVAVAAPVVASPAPAAAGISTHAKIEQASVTPTVLAGPEAMRPLIARHARANDVPETLVHRVIQRESRYNPRAVGSGGALGLMQIKLATARRMGYRGGAEGLLDADQNMKYAVAYLAGAYKVAGGDHDQAVRYYASGYYYAAKARRMLSVYNPVADR